MEKTTAVSTLKAGFENSFAALPQKFYESTMPESVHGAVLEKFNRKLGRDMGFSFTKETPELGDCLAGNLIFADSEPIAMAYAGHQFGNFVPQLGDGRAILLGEKKLRTENVLMSSSKVPDGPGSHGEETASLPWGR